MIILELSSKKSTDAVTRLLPGALGNEDSTANESFSALPAASERAPWGRAPALGHGGILDYPHYTRPQNFRGWEVPEILVSGHHEEVRRWRQRMALEKTRRNRPDLLAGLESASWQDWRRSH